MSSKQDCVIRTMELTRSFGALTAVADLALEVPQGCVFGFLGPNGAGKTTTIRMLLGLIQPDSGRVELFGQDSLRNRLDLLKRIGALVEAPSLYPHLTGRENLEVTRRLRGVRPQRIAQVLGVAGLEKAADRKVLGYSQGMKQRLSIALALLGDPELLILDEPTNGLDPAGILEIREFIQSLPQEQGISVFLSSHLLNEVEQVADRIAIILSGRMRFQGSLEELQRQKQACLRIKIDNAEKAVHELKQMGYADINSRAEDCLVVGGVSENEAGPINHRLVLAGISVRYLAVEQPTLEDLFLILTSDSRGDMS
jgi:ABC-type multidrug transport system ATPase subunit